MLSHWVVMVMNGNVPCHLRQCKCPDQEVPTVCMGPTVITLKTFLYYTDIIEQMPDRFCFEISGLTSGAMMICHVNGPTNERQSAEVTCDYIHVREQLHLISAIREFAVSENASSIFQVGARVRSRWHR